VCLLYNNDVTVRLAYHGHNSRFTWRCVSLRVLAISAKLDHITPILRHLHWSHHITGRITSLQFYVTYTGHITSLVEAVEFTFYFKVTHKHSNGLTWRHSVYFQPVLPCLHVYLHRLLTCVEVIEVCWHLQVVIPSLTTHGYELSVMYYFRSDVTCEIAYVELKLKQSTQLLLSFHRNLYLTDMVHVLKWFVFYKCAFFIFGCIELCLYSRI